LEGAVVTVGSNAFTFWHCSNIAVPGSTPTGLGSAFLFCAEFNPTGIVRTVSNSAFSWNVNLSNGRGVLKFREESGELLVGIGGELPVFDFNVNTGLISNDRLVVSNPNNVGYSGEFSSDGTKIYYSLGNFGFRGQIQQFDRISQTSRAVTGSGGP
jgi:hypothetical protein